MEKYLYKRLGFKALSNALRACVSIYIRQLSSFRVPTLWFIDLAVATCHIQYTFLSLFRFFSRENGQNTRILEGRMKMADDGYWACKALFNTEAFFIK